MEARCFSPFEDSLLLRETTSTPTKIPDISTSETVCGVESVQVLSSEADAECLMEQFPNYLKDILTGGPNEQYFATLYFHRLLSAEGSPYVQEVIDAGVVPCCVRFLEKDDQQVGDSTSKFCKISFLLYFYRTCSSKRLLYWLL